MDAYPDSCSRMTGEPYNAYKNGSLYYDRVELTDEYRAVIRKVEREVRRLLRRDPMRHQMGFCFIYWDTKQKILREKYGIIWRTPAEMNPEVRFD